MIQIIKELNIEVSKPNVFQAVVAKQYDMNTRFIKATFVDGGEKITIPKSDTTEAYINALRNDGKSDSFYGEINDDGTVTVPLHSWMLELVGTVLCDITVLDKATDDAKKLTTTSFTLIVEKAAWGGDDIANDPQGDVLIDLLNRVETAGEMAEDALQKSTEANAVYDRMVEATRAAEAIVTDWQNEIDKTNGRIDEMVAMDGVDSVGKYTFTGDWHITGTIKSNGVAAEVKIIARDQYSSKSNYIIPPKYMPMSSVDLSDQNDEGNMCWISPNNTNEDGWGCFEFELQMEGQIPPEQAVFAARYDLASVSIPELADIRVGYDGTMYDSAGEAVQEQVREIGVFASGHIEALERRVDGLEAGGAGGGTVVIDQELKDDSPNAIANKAVKKKFDEITKSVSDVTQDVTNQKQNIDDLIQLEQELDERVDKVEQDLSDTLDLVNDFNGDLSNHANRLHNLETADAVASVNGQKGAVQLTASDVGARPNTWMPSHTDVGADKAGTANTTVATHNTKTDAHNDIRLLITALTTRLDALANSDDTTLDQMAEVVAYIKANRGLIEQVTTGKVSVADIVNNLTTNVANKPLSAAQGVALKALIDELEAAANSIASITKTATSGLVDTYTITYTNGTKSTYTVTNGADGKTPVKGVDYYTEADKAEIVALVIESLGGNPVFGVVDGSNNIIVSGNLPDGTYSVKYEMENGTKVNIGNLVLDTNVYYTVTNNLTNCTNSNSATKAVQGGSYSATITANSGYELKSVTATMGGSAVSVTNDKINISNVTGNIVITAVAEAEAQETNYFNKDTATLNARLGSSGSTSSYNGMVTTDFIPVNSAMSGKNFKVSGITLINSTAYSYSTRYIYYNSAKTKVKEINNNNPIGVNSYNMAAWTDGISGITEGYIRITLVIKDNVALTDADVANLKITLE